MKKLFFFVTVVLFSAAIMAQNWQAKSTGLTGTVNGIDYVNNSIVWISTSTGDVARSTDGGATWTKGANAGDGGFTIAAISDKIALVATGPSTAVDGKIVRTTDGGATWTTVYTKAGAWFDGIDNLDATNLWAVSDPVGGKFLIVKSTDAGVTWTEMANAPAQPASNVFGANNSFYRVGNTAWFGTGGASGATLANKVYKNVKVPDSAWTVGTTTAQYAGALAFSSATGNGLAGFWSNNAVNKTTDGGATWSAISGVSIGNVASFDYIIGTNYAWAATTTGVFRTSNNGTAWVKDSVPTGSTAYYAVKFNGDANVGLVGGDNGVVFKSLNSPILPVELTSFTAAQNGNQVNLNWRTATETNNKGFEVERKVNGGSFVTVAFKAGAGTVAEARNYTYTDNLANLGVTTVSYRLKQVDFDGSYEYSNVATINFTAPVKFDLSQNYPNPFNPSTVINYQVPADNFVSLKVFNSLGQLVSTLVNEVKTAGSYNINFNASKLSTGVYYAVLKVGNSSEMTKTIKMSLIK